MTDEILLSGCQHSIQYSRADGGLSLLRFKSTWPQARANKCVGAGFNLTHVPVLH
ncbi:MAG: hypothetical protein ABIO64_01150 [Burkholderiaceae bacterium]